MAQVDQVVQKSTPSTKINSKNVSVTVAQTGNTTLLTVNVAHLSRLVIQAVVAGQALDAFIVSGKATPDAPAVILFSIATDWTTPAGLMIDASGDFTTLAVGGGYFVMDVRGFDTIICEASSGNLAGSTVSLYAGGV